MTSRPLVLGLDCSTQSISAVVLDGSRAIVHECSLRFDEELPVYRTTNGVVRDATDPNVVSVPSLMLVDALDRILQELARHTDKFNLSDVACISGSAQQHTSAYWRRRFSLRQCLDAAPIDQDLVAAIHAANGFSQECGPSWMDSSTTQYCEALETAVGGSQHVARISGSRAYPRFTGNQIAKAWAEDSAFVARTGRIALASSLLTSLLVGDFAPIDSSDGSGMNLLDLKTQEWSTPLLAATTKGTDQGERLLEMLGPGVVPPHHIIGGIHQYFQRKYGFRSSCKVAPFSGDNPCTLAGLGLSQPGDVVVSLGTSSTLMAVVEPLDTAVAMHEGHFFLNPVDPATLMAMICFKNGALAREDVRTFIGCQTWAEFEDRLTKTEPGNQGTVGFFVRDPEITPSTTKAGTVVFDREDRQVACMDSLDPASLARAIVESQCLALRLHAHRLGIRATRRLIATGGGAASDGFLQVLANVFGVAVHRLESASNSAALGAAFRADHALRCAANATGFEAFNVDDALQFSVAAEPQAPAVAVYEAMLPRFELLEHRAVELLTSKELS